MAKEALRKRFLVHEFYTEGITYDAVSCHPDVFMQHSGKQLVLAPNIPRQTIDFLDEHAVKYMYGQNRIGHTLRETTFYNCIATENALFHKKGYTDPVILELAREKQFVDLPQAYTRCSMLALQEDLIITSDAGIEKKLVQMGFNIIFVPPQGILLPPYKHGFIGGCFGWYNNELFVLGSFNYLKNGNEILKQIEEKGIVVHELCDEPLYDGGGVFIL